MVDDEAAIEVEEALLDAPERRDADELMDHGAAGDELGPMRHSAAHVLAEAVLDLFPGTKLGIGRSSPTASTTISCCRAR